MNEFKLDCAAGELSPAEAGKSEGETLLYHLNLKEFLALTGVPHKKNLAHSLNFVRYCKVETFHDCIQGTMRVPNLTGKSREPLVFGFCMVPGRLYLIEEGSLLLGMIGAVRNDILPGASLGGFLLLLFNYMIEDDILGLHRLEDHLRKLEGEVLHGLPRHFDAIVMDYRRQLSENHTYYEQLADIGDCMQAVLSKEEAVQALGWSLFARRTERLRGYVDTLREYLQQIRELYLSRITLQQNRVMTLLTVVTTLFLPLSLITGWYGMNFTGMPELGWRYGYPAVIVLSLAVIGIELWWFRRKGLI